MWLNVLLDILSVQWPLIFLVLHPRGLFIVTFGRAILKQIRIKYIFKIILNELVQIFKTVCPH